MKFYSTIEDVDRLFRCYNVDMNKWHLKNHHIPPYSIFFFLYQNLTSFAWIKMENLGEVAFFGSRLWGPRKVPHLWWLGKSLSFPNFQSLTISQLLMGPKPQLLGGFLEVFFFLGGGGGGSQGSNRGIWFFWSGKCFAFQCCSLDFFCLIGLNLWL